MLNNQIVLFPTIKPLIYHIIPAIFKPFAIVPIPPVISTRRFWTSTWRPWTEWRWPPLQRTPFVCRTSSAWPRRPRWTRSTRRTVEPRRRCMRRCSRRCRSGWGWKRAGFWWKKQFNLGFYCNPGGYSSRNDIKGCGAKHGRIQIESGDQVDKKGP